MSDTVIIKPDITPEEKLKRLNNTADVLTRVTGYKCQYIVTDEEICIRKRANTTVNPVKRKA